MIEFLKKYWKWVLLAVIVIIAVIIYLKRNKESRYGGCSDGCCDCGPGGMAGGDGSVIIGSEEYKKGRKIAIDRLNNAAKDLGDVMKIDGVFGYGPITNIDFNKKTELQYIEVSVKDELARKKVIEWVESKNKANPTIPYIPGSYMGYPINVIITEQTKALNT